MPLSLSLRMPSLPPGDFRKRSACLHQRTLGNCYVVSTPILSRATCASSLLAQATFAAVAAKSEYCTCSEAQVLQQNHLDNVAEYLSLQNDIRGNLATYVTALDVWQTAIY